MTFQTSVCQSTWFNVEFGEKSCSLIGKIDDGYVRTIRVPFFIPQKSLKGVQIHRLVSYRVTIFENFDQNLGKIPGSNTRVAGWQVCAARLLVVGPWQGPERTLEGTEIEENSNFREFCYPYWHYFTRNLGFWGSKQNIEFELLFVIFMTPVTSQEAYFNVRKFLESGHSRNFACFDGFNFANQQD